MKKTKRDVTIDAIRARLKDQVAGVRTAAIEALAELKDVGSIDLIREMLNDREPTTRMAALKALGELGAPAARTTGGFNLPKPPALDDKNVIIKEDKS